METSEKLCQFLVGGNLYCLIDHPTAKFPSQTAAKLDDIDDERLLVSVVNWTKPCFTNHDLDSVSNKFSTEDDVWCRSFLSG